MQHFYAICFKGFNWYSLVCAGEVLWEEVWIHKGTGGTPDREFTFHSQRPHSQSSLAGNHDTVQAFCGCSSDVQLEMKSKEISVVGLDGRRNAFELIGWNGGFNSYYWGSGREVKAIKWKHAGTLFLHRAEGLWPFYIHRWTSLYLYFSLFWRSNVPPPLQSHS